MRFALVITTCASIELHLKIMRKISHEDKLSQLNARRHVQDRKNDHGSRVCEVPEACEVRTEGSLQDSIMTKAKET